MTGRNYDIQTSYLESLISLGLYNELLMVYETGFYNDLPHLYKMPNKLVLASLLTISTLFDHCNIKEIESQIYNNVKNLYSPVSVRAIHILNGFYQTVIGNNGVDQDYGSIHYGELYTGSVLSEDKEKLKIRLIELVSFIGQKKPDERHSNRILQNEPLSVLARTNTWKVFQWAISCSKNEFGESLEDVVKYQCWKGWSRVLNFVLDIINLDLTDRIHKDQPLSDSIAAQWISQLRTRFFTGPIIHSIFIDKYDRLPEHLRKSFAKPDVAPIYANELNVLTDSIILDTFENSDLVCFQRKTILLVYKYMVADDMFQHTADLIKTIVLYLKVFSLTELNAFFFNTTKGGAFQTNSSNDIKLLNRMLLRVAIAMLDELSDSHTLSELFEFEGKQSNPQAELGKLNQLLMKEENLVLLLELEPSLLWITNSSVPEFTTQHIEKNADILVDYLELAVKQQGSYYDKLMKVNTLVYFILQLWLINRLEELSNAEKTTILTAVQTAETYKMRNMKLIIRQNLESKNVSSTQSVKMLVDSVVQLNKIDVISRNIASMFGMSGNE